MLTHGRRPGSIALIIVGLAFALWMWMPNDDHAAFRQVAYPCLPLDTTTTDPADFIMVRGLRAPPNQHTLPDGTVVYPVFSHPDPAVVPLVDGAPLFFPARLIEDERFGLETPPLPPNGQPLHPQHRFGLVRYLGDETRTALQAAIERTR